MPAGGVAFIAMEQPISLPIGTRGRCRVTTTVGLGKSHYVGYFNAGHGDGVCAGAMPMTADPVNRQGSGIGTDRLCCQPVSVLRACYRVAAMQG
jgi:hypothetical protein